MIADTQYADADGDALPRFYRAALGRLQEAVDTFTTERLDFVVCLGDMIDRSVEDWPPVAAALSRLSVPVHHILGNHDLEATFGSRERAMAMMGIPTPWQAWSARGVRFLALDTNEDSALELAHGSPERAVELARIGALAAAGQINAQPWNGGVSAAQLAWLDSELAGAASRQEQVVVVGHHPLAPFTSHSALNATEVLAVLDRHEVVRAVFSGHKHDGDNVVRNAVHYVTFTGMVETERTAYAIVEMTPEVVRIQGFGREPHRALRSAGVGAEPVEVAGQASEVEVRAVAHP